MRCDRFVQRWSWVGISLAVAACHTESPDTGDPAVGLFALSSAWDTTGQDGTRAQKAKIAFETFRAQRSLIDAPPYDGGRSQATNVVHLSLSSTGTPRGIFAYADSGLDLLPSGKDPETFVREFVTQNEGLWGFSSGDIALSNATFHLLSDSSSISPSGRHVRRLEFEQRLQGQLVLDGGLAAVFWDNILTSVSGPIFVLADIPNIAGVDLPVTEVKALAAAALASVGIPETHALSLENEGLHSQLGRTMLFVAAPTESDRGGAESFFVWTDSTTGHVVSTAPTSQSMPSMSGTYRVYKPSFSDTSSRAQTQANVTGYVSDYLEYYVFPWVDTLSNRSPVPTYQEGIFYSGTTLLFPYNVSPSTSFVSTPGGTPGDFHTQHASYWVQKAIHTGDINFTWWPPSNASYKYQQVTVIASCDGTTRYGNNGCWEYDLWRSSDGAPGQNPRVGCICAGRSSAAYPGGHATYIDGLFHEAGHAIDSKYLSGNSRVNAISGTCDPNTSEEGWSLSEAIAPLYSMMMFLQEFGSATAYTDYDGISNILGSLGGTVGEAVVHQDDNSVVCHAPHNACGGSLPCKTWAPNASPPWESSCDSVYRYAVPLLQAYWESAHAKNCDGPAPCWDMNDGAGVPQARWALFYAMKNTSASGTHWDFTANFLTYYYYDVGSTPWNNRWWVFNHHRLVGPDYGYSPCHAY